MYKSTQKLKKMFNLNSQKKYEKLCSKFMKMTIK